MTFESAAVRVRRACARVCTYVTCFSILCMVLLSGLQKRYPAIRFSHELIRYTIPCPSRTFGIDQRSLIPDGSAIYIYYLHARPDTYLNSLLDVTFGSDAAFVIRASRVQFVPYVVSVSGDNGNASLRLSSNQAINTARTLCPSSSLFDTNLFLTFLELFKFLVRERPSTEAWFIVSEDDVLLLNQEVLLEELAWCISQVRDTTQKESQTASVEPRWRLGFYLLESNTPSCRYGYGMTLFFIERSFMVDLIQTLESSRLHRNADLR